MKMGKGYFVSQVFWYEGKFRKCHPLILVLLEKNSGNFRIFTSTFLKMPETQSLGKRYIDVSAIARTSIASEK